MLAALLLAAAPVAAPAVSAKAFVESIYARWAAERRRGHWQYQPPRGATLFTPEMAALFAKDQRISRRRHELAFVDAVPLCACQDDAGMTSRVEVMRADQRAATARVLLWFDDHPAEFPLILHLARLPAGWRIADIGPTADASLRRQLHAALDRER